MKEARSVPTPDIWNSKRTDNTVAAAIGLSLLSLTPNLRDVLPEPVDIFDHATNVGLSFGLEL